MKGLIQQPSDLLGVHRLIMVVGNYGSGKTEVAVNLAIGLSRTGHRVRIADLDVVNPYFRCREALDPMQAAGVEVVVPPASQLFADLPIVLPEIRGMLHPRAGEISLFDVGGDPVGARLLSSLVEPLGDSPYALWQVINSRRPFTDSVQGCIAMHAGIQEASRLKVTGLVVNSHLVTETTVEVILEGYRLGREVGERTGLPVVFVTAMGNLAESPALSEIEAPVLRLERMMLPPWLKRREDTAAPAARSVPLGRRLGVK